MSEGAPHCDRHRLVCFICCGVSSSHRGRSTLGLQLLMEEPACVSLAEAEGGEPWGRGGQALGSGKALLGVEEGAPNQSALWKLAQMMVYNANLGACQGHINTA